MNNTTSIFTHAKQVFFTTYTRIVAILIVSVVATFLIGIGSTAGLLYYVTGLNYFTPDFFSVFLETSSSVPWILPFGIGISILAMFLLFFITSITSATIAFVLIRSKSLSESIRFGFTKGLRSIPVQALFFLLVFASSLPSFFLIIFATGLAPSNPALFFVLFGLGVLLLLLPFLIGLRSIFAVFIWLENQKARAWVILKKSFALTRGAVAWMMVLAIVIAGTGIAIIQPILVLVLSELSLLVLPSALLSGETFSAIIDQIISIFLLMPIMYALFYTFYVYAKKQGIGIKKRSV